MRRRALLASLAGLSTGCVAPGASGPTDTATPTDDPTTPAGTTTGTPPGPPGESRFAGRSVPDVGDDPTAWYHEADEGTDVYLRPSVEEVSLPAEVTLTAVNRGVENAGCGGWTLYELDGEEWYRLFPWAVQEICALLAPRETRPFAVDLRADRPPGGVPTSGGPDGATLGPVGGGTYAVTAGYRTDGAGVAALLEVTADPLTRPFADVTTERDGSTVTATDDAWRNASAEGRAVVTAERGADAPGAETTVAEQLSLLPGAALWNAVAPFETFGDGVGTVRLRTAESEWSTFPFGFDADRVAFRLRGETYEVTVDRTP